MDPGKNSHPLNKGCGVDFERNCTFALVDVDVEKPPVTCEISLNNMQLLIASESFYNLDVEPKRFKGNVLIKLWNLNQTDV